MMARTNRIRRISHAVRPPGTGREPRSLTLRPGSRDVSPFGRRSIRMPGPAPAPWAARIEQSPLRRVLPAPARPRLVWSNTAPRQAARAAMPPVLRLVPRRPRTAVRRRPVELNRFADRRGAPRRGQLLVVLTLAAAGLCALATSVSQLFAGLM